MYSSPAYAGADRPRAAATTTVRRMPRAHACRVPGPGRERSVSVRWVARDEVTQQHHTVSRSRYGAPMAVDAARVRRELEAILGARRVSVAETDLDVYAKDMWPRLLLAERGGERAGHRPHVVVWPDTARGVAAV